MLIKELLKPEVQILLLLLQGLNIQLPASKEIFPAALHAKMYFSRISCCCDTACGAEMWNYEKTNFSISTLPNWACMASISTWYCSSTNFLKEKLPKPREKWHRKKCFFLPNFQSQIPTCPLKKGMVMEWTAQQRQPGDQVTTACPMWRLNAMYIEKFRP